MLSISNIQALSGSNTHALITAIGAWSVYLGSYLSDILSEIRRKNAMNINDMIMYRDKEGKPLTIDQWSILVAHPRYRQVKFDLINGYVISTVWLGLWHCGDMFFETAIWKDGQENKIDEVYRYQTMKDAEIGHDLIVDNYRKKNELPVQEASKAL
jgi:hypothetical protein